MSPRRSSSFATAVVVAGLLPGCDGVVFDGGFFPEPFFATVTAEKNLALTLGARPLEFRVPVTTSPPSPETLVTVAVAEAARPLRMQFVDAGAPRRTPDAWLLVQPGDRLENGLGTLPAGRLSLGRDPNDVDEPLPLRLVITVTSSGDVDFDGLDDGVTVAIGALEPLLP
jgi:hypothetical protein